MKIEISSSLNLSQGLNTFNELFIYVIIRKPIISKPKYQPIQPNIYP